MTDTEVQSSRGAGYTLPARRSDCSGRRPSWHPFQINVCDDEQDGPDPEPLTGRQLTVPAAGGSL